MLSRAAAFNGCSMTRCIPRTRLTTTLESRMLSRCPAIRRQIAWEGRRIPRQDGLTVQLPPAFHLVPSKGLSRPAKKIHRPPHRDAAAPLRQAETGMQPVPKVPAGGKSTNVGCAGGHTPSRKTLPDPDEDLNFRKDNYRESVSTCDRQFKNSVISLPTPLSGRGEATIENRRLHATCSSSRVSGQNSGRNRAQNVF